METEITKKHDELKPAKKNTSKSRKIQNNLPKIEENIELIKDLYSYSLHLRRCFPMIEKPYSDNMDILEMHDLVMKKFEFEKIHKTRILYFLMNAEKEKLTRPLYRIEIRDILRNIRKFEIDILDLQREKQKTEYLSRTQNLIHFFESIGHKKKIITFGSSKQSKKEDQTCSTDTSRRLPVGSVSEQRKFLIEKYINVLQNFHEINIIYPSSSRILCKVCKYDITKFLADDLGGIVCPRCNTEKTAMINTCIISDVKFNNSKDGYEDRENFWKALQRFQGKQNNHIPERLYKELDDYFKSFGLPSGEQTCKMELTKKGTRGNTSRSMMFKALSETNNSVFYEDVNLICHLYWGWLLPDISADEDQIMKDYDNTQEVFKKIPKDRRSSLNAQYRLWQHLRIRGYRYPIEDFKIVKTPDILVEHDRIMRIMCEECNLDFIPAL